jgi:hypothetical protein
MQAKTLIFQFFNASASTPAAEASRSAVKGTDFFLIRRAHFSVF